MTLTFGELLKQRIAKKPVMEKSKPTGKSKPCGCGGLTKKMPGASFTETYKVVKYDEVSENLTRRRNDERHEP